MIAWTASQGGVEEWCRGRLGEDAPMGQASCPWSLVSTLYMLASRSTSVPLTVCAYTATPLATWGEWGACSHGWGGVHL